MMPGRYWTEYVAQTVLWSAAACSIVIVVLIFLFLGNEALPFARAPGIGELLEARWNPVSFTKETFGVVPLVTGSLLVTLLAIVIAVPFGVGGAVYLAEIATARERAFLKPFLELLAGIPSVVIGFFGLVVVAPMVKYAFGLATGLTALSGAVLLALMAVPTILSVSEDVIRSVPSSYKQASLALGANRLQTTWRVTVPAARSGIFAAVMLGVGRVIGETMVVLMVTGNAAVVTMNPTQSVRTMTATIAAEMGEVAFGGTHYRALFCVGVLLLLATFGMVVLAQRQLQRRVA